MYIRTLCIPVAHTPSLHHLRATHISLYTPLLRFPFLFLLHCLLKQSHTIQSDETSDAACDQLRSPPYVWSEVSPRTLRDNEKANFFPTKWKNVEPHITRGGLVRRYWSAFQQRARERKENDGSLWKRRARCLYFSFVWAECEFHTKNVQIFCDTQPLPLLQPPTGLFSRLLYSL